MRTDDFLISSLVVFYSCLICIIISRIEVDIRFSIMNFILFWIPVAKRECKDLKNVTESVNDDFFWRVLYLVPFSSPKKIKSGCDRPEKKKPYHISKFTSMDMWGYNTSPKCVVLVSQHRNTANFRRTGDSTTT